MDRQGIICLKLRLKAECLMFVIFAAVGQKSIAVSDLIG